MADKNFTIKTTISFTEFKAIVDFVVDKCFDENGNYDPTYKNFWFNYCVLNYYTDYPLFTIPDHSIDEIFEQVYSNECIDLVKQINHDSCASYNDMNTAIAERIEHRLNCKYKTSAYSLTDISVSSFIDKLSESLDNIGNVIDIEKIGTWLNNFVNNLDKEDTAKNNITVSSKDGD